MMIITLSTYNDTTQEIIQYDILAWLSWPLELITLGYRRLVEWIKLSTTGSCVALTHEWVKERVIPIGAIGKPSCHRTLRTTILAPYRKVTRYEDRADYQQALENGIGSTVLCKVRVCQRFKNER